MELADITHKQALSLSQGLMFLAEPKVHRIDLALLVDDDLSCEPAHHGVFSVAQFRLCAAAVRVTSRTGSVHLSFIELLRLYVP
jgi:hypothetical protein